jgi:uncharacterized protein (DUF1800 family)
MPDNEPGLTPLDKGTPIMSLHPMLIPWQPTATEPFDALRAAHLLNRAGFGGTPEDVQRGVSDGPIKAVDALLAFPDKPATETTPDDLPNFSALEGYPANGRELARMFVMKPKAEQVAEFMKFQVSNRAALVSTGDWWLRRMRNARFPLQEKLTLFWHGHFTTSAGDERLTRLMWRQNEMLRASAAGNFERLVKSISRDPAMLDYLNNNQNSAKHPNENYARELMELFTLGVGHYTETDVKEAARAFTGWGHNGEEFVFRRFDHDDGRKTFLGKTGNFDGDDVIDIILAQPQCAKYLAGRLWSFFVSDEDADPAVIESLAEVIRQNKYELRPALQTLFTSRAFYDAKVIGTQIKSPIQLVVGTARLLDVDLPPGRIIFQQNSPLAQMGQVPFYPPNVKGWPGGRTWINTSTLLVRYNACVRLANEAKPDNAESPAAAVEAWVARLVQRPIGDDQRKVLIDAVGFKATTLSIKEMIELVVSMPEYQLC